MKLLSEYELRQIKRMEIKIEFFENKKIDLFSLINDLTGLLNTLESVDNLWQSHVQSEINTLELLYDSIQDDSISKWRGNPKEDMSKSIAALKNLISNCLVRNFKLLDPIKLDTAITTGTKWLICPKCQHAWESNVPDSILSCPSCQSALNNPLKFQGHPNEN